MKKSALSAFAALLAACAVLVASCAKPAPLPAPDPSLVEAHSGDLIGRSDPIRVVFTRALRDGAAGSDATGLFRFEPSVKGRAVWIDERSAEFQPAAPLTTGRSYRAIVDPSALLGKAPGSARFGFPLTVEETPFSVSVEAVSLDAEGRAEISGTVKTDASEDPQAIERLLKVSSFASGAKLSWRHEGGVHSFTISGLKQGAVDSSLTVAWNGSAIGSNARGTKVERIPGVAKFNLLAVRPTDPGDDFVELAFSRALDRKQDLRGLVSLDGVEDLRYSIDGNKVRIYPASLKLPAKTTVKVSPGLRDSQGRSLALPVSQTVTASSNLPQVRFVGGGVIVPTSQSYTLPIETMNLKGVYVEAFKIYAQNIPQFLQVNDLDGARELKRVGAPVWSKSFDFDMPEAQRDAWVRRGLDLSELVKRNPDGMFQIRVNFTRQMIDYVCPNDHPDFSGMKFPPAGVIDSDENSSGESSYWDFWGSSIEEYSWDSPYNYYRNRNDPCHPSFYLPLYNGDRTARRNVLVSNIGLLAKAEADGTLHLYASDLRSTEPLAGVSLSVLNYQELEVGKGVSDASGTLTLKPAGIPFLVCASKDGQLGYVKLDEASSLKTSSFDVDGDKADLGVKGFIYGERGVWRPGDDIHLTFILHDPAHAIPADHPVLFELQDPRGQVVSRQTLAGGVNGFYAIPASTAADAPTGDWLARVKVGNREFTKGIKVETVMPNRLKMGLDFGSKGYLSSDPQDVTLSASWLAGMPAPGLQADVSVTFSQAGTSFPGYGDYTFDDPTRTVSGERQTVFQGNLDQNSKAEFPMTLTAGDAVPGKLNAQVLTRVYEPSGVFSSEQFSIPYHPYERYVGIKAEKGDAARGMLLTDIAHPLDIVVLDRDGKPAPSADIECSISEISWRWWWEKGDENLAEYQSSEYYRPIDKKTIHVANGHGTWNFTVPYPAWGRFLIQAKDLSGGHSTAIIKYIDWPGWAGRAQKDSGGAAMLSITTDKTSYSVGDQVTATFPSNELGKALVVVEKSGRILKQGWVVTTKDTTRYTFTASPEMAPNVYLHVTFLQQHLQTANDLPIRLYGVAPVMVQDPATHIQPVIDAPDTLKPLGTGTVRVSEKSGRAMTYTLAVVDEGLLGLTRFSAPDPWKTFYKKEASALKSWDLYQYVSGAFTGKLETLLAIGGSDDLLNGGNRKANRFQPVVQYLGPFSLAAGATGTHTIAMPQYVGAVRFMVVAGTPAGAYGVAEKSATVKSDLMALGTLPRVLSPGEKIAFPVSVFSYLPGRKDVSVSVSAEGAASISGPATALLAFDDQGDKTATFQVLAGSTPGLAKFHLRAVSGGAAAAQDYELDVRSLGLPVTVSWSGLLDAKTREWSPSVDLPGTAGTNTLILEASRIPPLNLSSRLDWLIAYPHGCIEQTTSSVFPQLYLPLVMDLPADKQARIRKNVEAGIERLKLFKTESGGFSYWPGESEASEWGSNYAGHFLLEARRNGYAVPDSLISDWISFQKDRSRLFSKAEDYDYLTQSYRLYTLALAKSPDFSAMNRLRGKKDLPTQASWRLAAAYWLAGQRDAATSMAKGLSVTVRPYRELGETFGSDIRDAAMILETLNLMGDSARAADVAKAVSSRLSSEEWMSTQETSYCLIALLPYAGALARAPIAFSWGASTTSSVTAMSEVSFSTPIVQVPISVGSATKASVKVSSPPGSLVYLRLLARGTPAMGNEEESSEGLGLRTAYYSLDGDQVSPDELQAGSDMEIRVTVENQTGRDLEQLALTHVLPSGWEIMNYRIAKEASDSGEGESAAKPGKRHPYMDYQDIRDDRVLTYFALEPEESKTFSVRVNKTYDGTFYLPSIGVEAMYDSSINAVAPGHWLKAAAKGDSPAAAPKPKVKKPKSK